MRPLSDADASRDERDHPSAPGHPEEDAIDTDDTTTPAGHPGTDATAESPDSAAATDDAVQDAAGEQAEVTEEQASAEVMALLSEHVPLALLADLAQPEGPASPKILADEGLPDEPWWEQ